MIEMDPSDIGEVLGHRLLQIGVVMLLLTSFWGFLIPNLASPSLGLSAHRLAAYEATLLLALGLVWPLLKLTRKGVLTAFWLFVYSDFAILAAYMLGAVWGAGGETMRMAAEGAVGTTQQELVIKIVAYSSAPTGIVSFALILWGLREWGSPPRSSS